jgi:hypothetical protein
MQADASMTSKSGSLLGSRGLPAVVGFLHVVVLIPAFGHINTRSRQVTSFKEVVSCRNMPGASWHHMAPAAPRMELPFWQGGTLWKLESAISMSWLGCAVQLGCGSWLYSTYSNDCCFPSRGDSGIGSSSAGQISLIMFNFGGDDVKGSRLKGLGRQRKASDSFNFWRIWRALKIRGTGLSVPEKWTTSWAPHLLRLEPSFGAAASFGLRAHRASVLKQ